MLAADLVGDVHEAAPRQHVRVERPLRPHAAQPRVGEDDLLSSPYT